MVLQVPGPVNKFLAIANCSHSPNVCNCSPKKVTLLFDQQQSYALPITLNVLAKQFCVTKYLSVSEAVAPRPELLPLMRYLGPFTDKLNSTPVRSAIEASKVAAGTVFIIHKVGFKFGEQRTLYLQFVQAGRQYEIGLSCRKSPTGLFEFGITHGEKLLPPTSQVLLNFKSSFSPKFREFHLKPPIWLNNPIILKEAKPEVPQGCEVKCYNCGCPNKAYFCSNCEMDIPPSQPIEFIGFSPEGAILQILRMVNSNPPHTLFSQAPCEYIGVGSYKIASDEHRMDGKLTVVLSSSGIYFEIPDLKGAIKKCVLVQEEIKQVEVSFHKQVAVLFVTVGAKNVAWLCANLEMSEKDGRYSPDSTDPCQKYVIFKFDSEDFSLSFHKGFVKKLYPKILKEITFAEAEDRLKKYLESMPIKAYVHDQQDMNRGTGASPTCENKRSATDASGKPQVPNSPNLGRGTPRAKLRKIEVSLTEDNPSPPPPAPNITESFKLLTRYNHEINSTDLQSLNFEQFINDTIVDFWLSHVHANLSETDRNSTHIFSSFFFKRMTGLPKRSSMIAQEKQIPLAERRHFRVRKWTKKIDIFEKDFVVIPIVEDSHWYVAIICYPGLDGIYNMDGIEKQTFENVERPFPGAGKKKCVFTIRREDSRLPEEPEVLPPEQRPKIKQPMILLFDSLRNGSNHLKLYDNLRKYLEVEYFRKKGTPRIFDKLNMPGFQPNVPQQPNHCDCAVYLLHYVESFFSNPVETYWLPFIDLSNWFTSSIVHTKRKEIFDTICNFIKSDVPENVDKIPKITFCAPVGFGEDSLNELEQDGTGDVMGMDTETSEDVEVDIEGD